MKRIFVATCALIASPTCALAQALQPSTPRPPLQRIEKEQLCVTNGVVSARPDGRLAIETPSARAVVRIPTAQTAEIRFRYVGPSATAKPLASGEVRRQIGLKLRAQDTCNLLYVMWHIEPDAKIAVALKHNPGKQTHAECHAGGYVPVKARTSAELPKMLPGESHTLRAELQGHELTVVADSRVVWEGTVGNRIAEFDGPVGLRTDNARFEFEYYAAPSGSNTHAKTLEERINRCLASPGD